MSFYVVWAAEHYVLFVKKLWNSVFNVEEVVSFDFVFYPEFIWLEDYIRNLFLGFIFINILLGFLLAKITTMSLGRHTRAVKRLQRARKSSPLYWKSDWIQIKPFFFRYFWWWISLLICVALNLQKDFCGTFSVPYIKLWFSFFCIDFQSMLY